jgi:hypothetical protein
LKKLNEPFPESETPKENIINILGIGLFITFFIYFFQVGGMNSYNGNAFLMCLGFGFITVAVALCLDFFVFYVFKLKRDEPSWTLKKWICYMLILLLLISQANYVFYCYLVEFRNIGWENFWIIFINTITIGMFPVIFSGLLVQLRSNQRNLIQAANLQSNFPKKEIHHDIVHLFSDNKNQDFQIHLHDIFYIEAMQNYVSVCFQKDGISQKELLRNTIKNLETQIQSSVLIRCHRSFMVNSDLIEKVEGNAQGLRLNLKNLEDFEVPVSRKYIPILKEIIK